jgi:hypothetical protein
LFLKLRCMKDFCSVVNVTIAILLVLSGLKPGAGDAGPFVVPTSCCRFGMFVAVGNCEMRKKRRTTTATSAIRDGCNTDRGK